MPAFAMPSHAPPEPGCVHLTFDDGPDPDWTPRVLDLLADQVGVVRVEAVRRDRRCVDEPPRTSGCRGAERVQRALDVDRVRRLAGAADHDEGQVHHGVRPREGLLQSALVAHVALPVGELRPALGRGVERAAGDADDPRDARLGLEERDETTLAKGTGEKVTVIASFRDDEAARAARKSLSALFAPKVEVIVGDRWRDEWKKHFKPFELCAGLWIRPPWEKASVPRGDRVLELEPGRAFGTGLHETTALVARVLASRRDAVRGKKILDVGTGSGILALVALALGGERAVGTDVDADAIAVAKENAKRNMLVYMVYSDKLVEGSPENSTATVAIHPWGGAEPAKCADWLK